MVQQFVASVVMTQQAADKLNIRNCVFFITANDEDQARGAALTQAMDQLPTYQLLTIMLSVPPEDWIATITKEKAYG